MWVRGRQNMDICLICFISNNCHSFVFKPIDKVSIQRDWIHHGPENLCVPDEEKACYQTLYPSLQQLVPSGYLRSVNVKILDIGTI